LEEDGGTNLYCFINNCSLVYVDFLGLSYREYIIDPAKILAEAFTVTAGGIIGGTAGWAGIGAVGGVSLILMGADQFLSGVRDMVNRASGKTIDSGIHIQTIYRDSAERITGGTGSGLVYTLAPLYFSAETASACATATLSIKSATLAVKGTQMIHTAGHWIVVDNMVKYEFVFEGGLTWSEAGIVIGTEAFSTTMSGISFLPFANVVEQP
jgi:hypothetical protein